MTTTLFRRARTALGVAAAVVVLATTGCGLGGGDSTETAPEGGSTGAAPSDGSGTTPSAGKGTPTKQDDGSAPADGGSTPSEGTPGAPAGGRVPVILIPHLSVGEIGDDFTVRVSSADLAKVLSDQIGAEATCDGELVMDYEGKQTCTAPQNSEAEGTITWYAHPVQTIPPEGYDVGRQEAILFTGGKDPGGETAEIRGSNYSLTGLGMGSMFGAEPISKEELGKRTLQVLTSENAISPVNEIFGDEDAWEKVTCEGELDFGDFQPVPCTATTRLGAGWSLLVLPGAFVDDDGLLVAIGSPHDI